MIPVAAFGPAIAANIRRRRGRPDCVGHLDEMVARIGGKRMFMWPAVDKEGEVLRRPGPEAPEQSSSAEIAEKTDEEARLHTREDRDRRPAVIQGRHARTRLSRATRSWPVAGGRERCNDSSPRVRLSASFQPTPRSTIPSPSSAISLPGKLCETSEPPLLPSGPPRPPLPDEISTSRLNAPSESCPDKPGTALFRSAVGIADVPDGEPGCQLRATILATQLARERV